MQVEDDNPDDEAKLVAFFGVSGVNYKKRKTIIELKKKEKGVNYKQRKKKFCDVSLHGVFSRISRLRQLLGKLKCMKEWKYMKEWTEIREEEERLCMEMQQSTMMKKLVPPGKWFLD